MTSRPTLAIPYVENDWDGQITSAVVEQVVKNGSYRYTSGRGTLTLSIQNVEEWDDNIGFRYDRNQKGNSRQRVIPVEGRLFIAADVSLIDRATCKELLGPARITAWIDFDHDYYDNRDAINVFSLGQLTDYEEAYDAALTPLYRRFAIKVVDYINHGNW